MQQMTSTQGDMWDNISKKEYSSEYYMNDILQANYTLADALTLPSENNINLPEIEINTSTTTPAPWEL